MATRDIKTKIQIDGEKELKDALSHINSGVRELKSEMNLASEEFADNAASMGALTKKGSILERQVQKQKEKVDMLKKAVEEATKATDANSSTTLKYKTDLNKAETELVKMNRELDQNKEALEKSGEATDKGSKKFNLFKGESQGLGEVLDKVSGKLGISLPSGMQETLNGMGKLSPAIGLVAGGFAAVTAAIAKAEKQLMEWTKDSAAFADNILTESTVTGLSTETLQEWNYAAELMDVDVNTATSSMTKMIRNMSNARAGTGKAAEAFEKLGVQIEDANGNLRDSETVFWDSVEALGGIENATERDATAMEIFGKSAQDLKPLILQGRDGFEALAAEAHEAGAVLDGEGLEALGAVDDAQQRLLQTQQAVTRQISEAYAPYMADALGNTRDFIKQIGDALVESGAVDSLGSILKSVSSMLQPLGTIVEAVLPALEFALKPVAVTLGVVADTLNLITGLLTFDFGRVKTALGYGAEASNTQMAMYGSDYKSPTRGGSWYNPETGLYEGNYYHASGTPNFAGGPTWVGEAGPERVWLPQGSRIDSAQESRRGGDIFIFNIKPDNIRQFNDLVRIAEDGRMIARMRG